jgi:hypothetical protein
MNIKITEKNDLVRKGVLRSRWGGREEVVRRDGKK